MSEDLTKATAPYRLSDSGKLLVRGDEPLAEAIDADRALMQRIADLLNYGGISPREAAAPTDEEVGLAWDGFESMRGYSMPEKLRAALAAFLKARAALSDRAP